MGSLSQKRILLNLSNLVYVAVMHFSRLLGPGLPRKEGRQEVFELKYQVNTQIVRGLIYFTPGTRASTILYSTQLLRCLWFYSTVCLHDNDNDYNNCFFCERCILNNVVNLNTHFYHLPTSERLLAHLGAPYNSRLCNQVICNHL